MLQNSCVTRIIIIISIVLLHDKILCTPKGASKQQNTFLCKGLLPSIEREKTHRGNSIHEG